MPSRSRGRRLVRAVDHVDRRDRAERRAARGRVAGHVRQQRRPVDGALRLAARDASPCATASSTRLCTSLTASSVMSGPMIVSGSRVTRLEARGLLRQTLRELVGDRALDDDPPRRHADLALVEERAEGRRVHRELEIGVGEHDQRVVPAELEQDALEVPARGLGQPASGLGRAGEVDDRHARVLDQALADRRRLSAGVGDDVQHAGRQPGPRRSRPRGARRRRRVLRGLEDDRVAERERPRSRAPRG